MAEVGDGLDAQPPQLGEGLVGERPVVAARREVRAVVRRPVAQVLQAQLAHQLEVLAPALVVAALRHLVDAEVAAVRGRDHGVAVLDPGGEEEIVGAVVMLTPGGGGFGTIFHEDRKAIRLPKPREELVTWRRGAGGGGAAG